MDVRAVRLMREEYKNLLAANPEYNKILFALSEKQDEEPITSIHEIEAESDLSYNDEQRQLSEILLDMHNINNAIQEVKDKVSSIIEEVDTSLNTVQAAISKQTEQVEDMTVLCGQNSLYNVVVPVYVSDFGETDAEMLDDKTIGAALLRSTLIPYDIVSVSGNGYSGNAFVYENGGFVSEIDDRSDLNYISDANDITVYEYSRLCADTKQAVASSYINYDDSPVECVVTLSAQEAVCKAHISSPDPSLCVTKLETSDDGIRYTNRLEKPLYINDVSKIYDGYAYIYGCPTLCFPYAKFVRITFSSNESHYEDIRIQEDDVFFKINARRKYVALAGIELYSSAYQEAALLSQEMLKSGNIDKISLFASEYIPDHFPNGTYVEYALILNGKEYPIVPVNTGRDGIKMIRHIDSTEQIKEYMTTIDETIKTVRLKITVTPYNGLETPYISNLKLCMGKNTGDIYV